MSVLMPVGAALCSAAPCSSIALKVRRVAPRAAATFSTLTTEKIMSLRPLKTALLAAIVSTSLPAFAGSDDSYYYWLHPKLGPIKVQRSTGAPLKTGPMVQGASAPAAGAPQVHHDADRCKPKFWLHPKGEMRRIVPKDCSPGG